MDTAAEVGLRWYTCECPRRIAVEDLDHIVLGLAYEHRRRLGDREFLTLHDETAMIARLVISVRIGPDWSKPIVQWSDSAANSNGGAADANDGLWEVG